MSGSLALGMLYNMYIHLTLGMYTCVTLGMLRMYVHIYSTYIHVRMCGQ